MVFEKDRLGKTSYLKLCCKCDMQIPMFVGKGNYCIEIESITVLIQARTFKSYKILVRNKKLIASES